MPLLAAGLQDVTVARQLGIATRTVERRMQTLMRELSATTRFQAGWLAAQRELGRQTTDTVSAESPG